MLNLVLYNEPLKFINNFFLVQLAYSLGHFGMKIASSENNTPALRRGAGILDAVASSPVPLTAAMLSRNLGLPKSTTHGLLGTMLELGMLVKAADGTYQIGPQIMRWAHAFLNQTDLIRAFQEHMAGNDDLHDYAITLSVLDGNDVVYLACRNSQRPLGFTFQIGMRLPAAFTATGKIMLSSLSDQEIQQHLKSQWPHQLTSRSVSNLDQLMNDIQQARNHGFSIDNGQIRDGMFCVGVAVRDFSNKVIAGLALSLLENEAVETNIEQVAEKLQAISLALSLRLGAPAGFGQCG